MKKNSVIGQQLLAYLKSKNMTFYQAAQKIALANGENFHAANMRLHRLVGDPNHFLLMLEASIAALGLRIKLVENDDDDPSE